MALCILNTCSVWFYVNTPYSVCRYQVNCEDRQVLSYSIHRLSLEQPATCGGQRAECVDWVRIESDSDDPEFRCGRQDLNDTFFLNGQTAADIEFVTNRNTEEAGFLIFITCSDQGFTQPRPGNENMKRAASEKCTFPPDTGWARVAQTSPRQAIVSTSFPLDHSLVVYGQVY